jgi:hypothetical protein
MPARTRAVLTQIARELRKAAGIPEPAPPPTKQVPKTGSRAGLQTDPRSGGRLTPTAIGSRIKRQ